MEIVNLKDRKDHINNAIESIKKYHENNFIGESDNVLNYCLIDENKIIGEIDFGVITPTADIFFVYVINEERGKGLSKILLKETFNLLKEKGVNEIFLEVRESNKIAYNLYKSMDFIEIGMRKKYYSNGENAIVMRTEL